MSKNKKNNKVKLSATDVALLCGMVHLDYVKMAKYEKKILKNNPSLNETMTLIGKDTKTFLGVMIGYHIAKIEKTNKKKKKKVAAKSRKSSKTYHAKNNPYLKTNMNRNFAGNTDGLFDSELPPLGILPTDNNDKTVAAVNTTANNEKSQDKQPDDKPVGPVGKDANSEPIRRVSPFDVIGVADVNVVFEPESGNRIAACTVRDGKLKLNAKAQVIRKGCAVYEGTITKLKRFKSEVDEVSSGFEAGVTIDNFDGIRGNDIIECFEDKAEDKDSELEKYWNVDDGQVPFATPKLINGEYFDVLVTNVDRENGKLTYLSLRGYRFATLSRIQTGLSDFGNLRDDDNIRLAEDFGIDENIIANGVDFVDVQIPTVRQIRALKEMYESMNINDEDLKWFLFNKPVLVDDGTEEGKHKSCMAMMPNGKLAKRNSNWNALVVPSVTIEF